MPWKARVTKLIFEIVFLTGSIIYLFYILAAKVTNIQNGITTTVITKNCFYPYLIAIIASYLLARDISIIYKEEKENKEIKGDAPRVPQILTDICWIFAFPVVSAIHVFNIRAIFMGKVEFTDIDTDITAIVICSFYTSLVAGIRLIINIVKQIKLSSVKKNAPRKIKNLNPEITALHSKMKEEIVYVEAKYGIDTSSFIGLDLLLIDWLFGEKETATNNHNLQELMQKVITRMHYEDRKREAERQQYEDNKTQSQNTQNNYSQNNNTRNESRNNQSNNDTRNGNRNTSSGSSDNEFISMFSDCDTAEKVKKRHRQLAKAFHSDDGDVGNEEKMKQLNIAYDMVMARFK